MEGAVESPQVSSAGNVLRPPEMAFFDVETTVPSQGQSHALLEFGAILVCPRRLVEVGCYSTLIRPSDPASISPVSVRCNGITRDAVDAAPTFREVADRIFDILHGRVWVGHNILRFDCARIREAFAEIGRSPPEPKGTIDTLPLLTQRFGRRAGNMKMATLATYFGLGQQKHRSLDDVRLNLEVLKYSAAVLFLESTLPEVFIRSLGDESTDTEGTTRNTINSTPGSHLQTFGISKVVASKSHVSCIETEPIENSGDTDLEAQVERMKIDQTYRSKPAPTSSVKSTMMFHTNSTSESCMDRTGFLMPEEIWTQSIGPTFINSNCSSRKLHLTYNNLPLQLCCLGLRILFGVSNKFLDHMGRPKLSIVVDAPKSLCHVLNHCDFIAQKASSELGIISEWRPVLRKCSYSNSSNVRLHIITPTGSSGESSFSTVIFKKEALGLSKEVDLSRAVASELDILLSPGTLIDACFSFDVYYYQGCAGIRLVTKKLVVELVKDLCS